MQLINTKETFDKIYPYAEEPKPIFTLKKLSYGQMQAIADETSVFDEKNRILYLAGTTAKLKIKYSVIAWKNITDESNKEVPCTDGNKENLPIAVGKWLVDEIDKLNRLNEIPEQEIKNS